MNDEAKQILDALKERLQELEAALQKLPAIPYVVTYPPWQWPPQPPAWQPPGVWYSTASAAPTI